jgi:hypothetical protein
LYTGCRTPAWARTRELIAFEVGGALGVQCGFLAGLEFATGLSAACRC